MKTLPKVDILGVGVTNASEDKILEYIVDHIKNGHKLLSIVTPNPEIIMYARTHPEFRKILNEADLAINDGVGVTLGGYLLGKGVIPRTTGVDLMEKLVNQVSKSAGTAILFGGKGNVAEKTSECLQKKYSGLNILYANSVWNETKLKGKKADILFVAMGFPKQEMWIFENLDRIPTKVAMGVGGAFDFISGNVPRAPKFLRSVGLEWLYRLVIQPWRWKRQLALVSFALLVFQEMIRMRMRSVK